MGNYLHYVRQIDTGGSAWTSGINFDTGDTLQVWVDFDNNRICIKKLGTTIDDYINYATE